MSSGQLDKSDRSSSFWTSFGPGLLWAAAAVGVSHLVQSTRAGAMAGFALIGVVVLALVLKYPFFEFGPRYAAATGTSLVEGYRRIGRWALWLFLAIAITTAVISQAAVILFTAFLVRFAFGIEWPLAAVAALLIAACAGLLWLGGYRALDMTVKLILIVLTVSTLVAAIFAAPRVDLSTLKIVPDGIVGSVVPFAFLLALVGWMPSPVDTSVWSSLWTLAKNEASGVRVSVRRARQDFMFGYIATGILAIAFLTLGAGVMYGSGVAFSPQGTGFSTQLVDLYSQTLGSWARPVVLAAVLTTMMSTTLTLVDGSPRVIEQTIRHLRSGDTPPPSSAGPGDLYWWVFVAFAAITVVILLLFIGNLTTLVDFATIVSFLAAPLLGYLNLKAVTSPEVAVEHRPGSALRALTWTGLVLLGGTGVFYLALLVAK